MYLLIQIVCTLFENISVVFKVNKEYPDLLCEKSDELTTSEKNNIFTNIKSLVVYKFGSVILNGTDNIIISSMFGT